MVGTFLAIAVGVFGTVAGMDRERSFYATITIVVGSLYSLFAVMGGSTEALVLEAGLGAVFLVAAACGFRRSSWILVAALAGHGMLDLVHGHVVDNAGVPPWWPHFCSAYDVTAAGYLAWRLRAAGRGGLTLT